MPPTYYLGLCAIAKDETTFLREWAGYHHFIGFEKIYVYDNESLTPARDTLAEFYDLGVCDTYTLQGQGMQLVAYNHCLKYHGSEFEWLAFFDIDEFLCLKQDDDARVLLRDYENYSALAVNWNIFGSSGHINLPRGLVIKNFTQSLGYNNNCKCIVRPAMVKMPFTAHHFIYTDGIAVNADCIPAYGAYAPLAVDKICLNHYQFRSQYDYEQKCNRSDATYGSYNHRSIDSFYKQIYAKTEESIDMLPLVDSIEKMAINSAWQKKNTIDFSNISNKTLMEIIELINNYMKDNNFAASEVILAMSYNMFKQNMDYMLLGIALLSKAGKFSRALSMAEELVRLHPAPPAYTAWLECLTLAGRRKEGLALRDFLEFILAHERDEANRNKIEAALQKTRDYYGRYADIPA
ncbi:MAG: glycosyltransferase family 92 protein [Desulfovibrio sp.]|nr:glycosyltransferase family 92 protein [Desulfovibrio sp.]